MSKVVTSVTAVRSGHAPLQYIVEHDGNHQPSREELAFQLVLLAQDRHTPPIPDGVAGASSERRLEEFGYRITSITHTPTD